jgi:hypothetical protein
VGELFVVTEGEIDIAAVLGANVVQVRGLAPGILPKMNLFQEHGGDGVFETNAVVAPYQSGIDYWNKVATISQQPGN